MSDKNAFDIRFIYYTQEIDLLAVVNTNDDIRSYSSNLRSFIDKCPGFVSFLKDPANRRNASSFASGVAVLKRLLMDIGCLNIMLEVAQLESAIMNRNSELRDRLINKQVQSLEQLCAKLKSIPRAEPAADKISDTLAAASKEEAERKKRILVVDDSPDILNAVEALLDTWFDVYSLSHSADYASILEKVLFDMFILDVEMPMIDGYQLFERIRSMTPYKNTPIVILTSHATPGNLQLAMEMGVDGFIRKPFDSDLMVNKICTVLAEAPQREYKLGANKRTVDKSATER